MKQPDQGGLAGFIRRWAELKSMRGKPGRAGGK
jgi:hypothetical protein